MREVEDGKWLTDLAFLVNLVTHLIELSMCLQGENQLICAMFQTITVQNETYGKLKLCQIISRIFVCCLNTVL